MANVSNMLKVGDTVQWSGGFGAEAARLATVVGIDRVQPGEKYGNAVNSMPWSDVRACAVVTLDNGHWAYGRQIAPLS